MADPIEKKQNLFTDIVHDDLAIDEFVDYIDSLVKSADECITLGKFKIAARFLKDAREAVSEFREASDTTEQ